MKTAKIIFWLGVIIMAVGLVVNLFNLVVIYRMDLISGIQAHAMMLNIATGISESIMALIGPFASGGILIGLSEIIEKLHDLTEKGSDDK